MGHLRSSGFHEKNLTIRMLLLAVASGLGNSVARDLPGGRARSDGGTAVAGCLGPYASEYRESDEHGSDVGLQAGTENVARCSCNLCDYERGYSPFGGHQYP